MADQVPGHMAGRLCVCVWGAVRTHTHAPVSMPRSPHPSTRSRTGTPFWWRSSKKAAAAEGGLQGQLSGQERGQQAPQAAGGTTACLELGRGAGLVAHRVPTNDCCGQLLVPLPDVMAPTPGTTRVSPQELDNLRDTSIQPSESCPQVSGLLPGKPTSGCARAFLENEAFPNAY